MSDSSLLQSGLPIRITARSMGVKLIVVCVLALMMTIPAVFVSALVDDRTSRAGEVIREISSHVGGEQTFLGPTLAIPYTIPAQSPTDTVKHGTYLVFPAQASAAVKTATEERRRSLFKVPVFQADLKFDAAFDLAGVPAALPSGATLDWNRAEIVVGVSDARGALADATLTADGKTTTLAPATIAPDLSLGEDQGPHTKLTLFGTNMSDVAKPGAKFSVTSALKFSGAQRIALLAYGKTTNLAAQGDWRSPGFDGGFLPTDREISGSGFTASWSVPFIARGVRAEGQADSIGGLAATALGVSFVEVADPYQSVNRSLKYALLFAGLIFLSYFVFEVSTGKRVHPAQYVLVGVAQIIFYLLLLSLAERVGFDWGFLLAGAATVVLLSLNAGWIFASRAQGWKAAAIFTPLYGLIYLLLRLEDDALLVGALASFVAIAIAMYFTRGIDWYKFVTGNAWRRCAGQRGSEMIALGSRPLKVKFILPALKEATDPSWRPIKYSLFPPLGLATLAAYLSPHDHAAIVDEHVELLTLDDAPDLVVIQVYITNAYRAYRIADHYRSQGAFVCLGGLHVTSLPDEAATHADAIFLGPGEQTFPRFLQDFRTGVPEPRYVSAAGRTLERVPPIRRDLIRRARYLVPNSIVVTRGCPQHCDFCYKDAFFQGGRSFYTQRVEDALAEIDRLPGRHLYFLDDHLLGDRHFAESLFDGMKGMGRVFQGAATVDSILRGDLIERAAEAGLRSIFVGFETLTQDNLRRSNKRQNLGRDYKAVADRLHSLGIMINGSFVFGMDDDGEDVFRRTVDWAVSHGITTATFHIQTPYPGTQLHARMVREGRMLTRDWRLYDTRHVVYRPAQLKVETLKAGYDWAYREFYRWGSIAHASLHHGTLKHQSKHFFYAAGWKKFEPLWDFLIRARQLTRITPLLEAVLSRVTGVKSAPAITVTVEKAPPLLTQITM